MVVMVVLVLRRGVDVGGGVGGGGVVEVGLKVDVT